MIDPTNITDYNLTDKELEEHILFWVCAAGKNGVTAASCLDKCIMLMRVFIKVDIENKDNLIYNGLNIDPDNASCFNLIKAIKQIFLPHTLRNAGIGCFNNKAKTFRALADSGLNLKNCSVADLESIPGIGPKTARCFLIHSRPNQKLAGLDVHILRFLKDKGYNVPKSTPTGKRYAEIEQYFIREAEKANMKIADFDLKIWNKYRNK